MDIFFGIDGTGASDDVIYREDFADSHVRNMWKTWHYPLYGYLRGPTGDGLNTKTLASAGVIWVKAAYEKQVNLQSKGVPFSSLKPRVFLSGYSRGGAAVTFMCHRLKDAGIDVHALLLFDAVDRSFMGDTDVIPSNVRMAYHARRSPLAGSREMFGNCALRAANKGGYEEAFFMCTHGGVGGTPWEENGDSGKIEELSTKEKSGVVAAGTLAGGVGGGFQAKKWADKNDFTNVTVKQDIAGSLRSREWMTKRLMLAKASNQTSHIGSIGPFNLAVSATG